ncbi:alpha/beta fold hydrolase [Sandaracinus amylolyticus]|uniref:alpha/beta fold hydrolase n=1 Tax=Sandaracinus amylolyticus TaxID=927083 RepID=UPI001F2251C1|nr:alpha/beta fold hydrolase [Sandaracinus amylolyticus]UJR80636.1 Pimeloyl-ACP methyl ester carboxylesterase [Sandaracinus amylolyticus]
MMESSFEPARRGRTRLPSGRMLGWSEQGPEHGAPALFFGGAGTSGTLMMRRDAVERAGVRLVAIDRPGLGASDPLAHRTLADWVEDVRAFVSARALGTPAIVAFSQGAPFGIACAADEIGRALVIVSGTDELAAPHLLPLLVPDVRGIVQRVASDPEGTEAFFRGMTPAMMREMVLAMIGDADRAVYAEPAFDATYRRALDEGFAQGAEGYARDTVLAMSAWPFDLGRIAMPVALWYGAEDSSPVHSPDLGASLAHRIPNARRTVVEGAGGAILWTHGDAILGSI